MSLQFCLPSYRARSFAAVFAALTLLSGAVYANEDAEQAKAIVVKADEIRFPRDGFQVIIDIASPPMALRRKSANIAFCLKGMKTPLFKPSNRLPTGARPC